MTIQKKSLISTLNTTKKAIVASTPVASSDVQPARPARTRRERTSSAPTRSAQHETHERDKFNAEKR